MTSIARTLLLVATSLALGACGIFGDDDDELEPAELIDFEAKLKIKRLWSAKLGADAEFLRVALSPAGDGNRIYAASRDGNVHAFDPATGQRIWRRELGLELVVVAAEYAARAERERRGNDKQRSSDRRHSPSSAALSGASASSTGASIGRSRSFSCTNDWSIVAAWLGSLSAR